MAKHYRTVWIESMGPIPKDENGRSFEIHHINGNHNDNRIENLQMLRIEEHFDVHFSQGDLAAAMMIARRLNKSDLGQIQKGNKMSEETKRKISEVKKSKYASGETKVWNKGVTHTQEVKNKMSLDRKGKRHSSKLKIDDVNKIRNILENKPELEYSYKKYGNGKISYEWLLAKNIREKMYPNFSIKCIYNILVRKSWNDC